MTEKRMIVFSIRVDKPLADAMQRERVSRQHAAEKGIDQGSQSKKPKRGGRKP
jgi:hypothetical protein